MVTSRGTDAKILDCTGPLAKVSQIRCDSVLKAHEYTGKRFDIYLFC
jgi:hypothetical protein